MLKFEHQRRQCPARKRTGEIQPRMGPRTAIEKRIDDDGPQPHGRVEGAPGDRTTRKRSAMTVNPIASTKYELPSVSSAVAVFNTTRTSAKVKMISTARTCTDEYALPGAAANVSPP